MKGKPSICWRAGVLALLAVAANAAAPTPVKDPLYGDPAHPNISGMWTPEFAYFGPPMGAAAAPPPAGGPGGALAGAALRGGGGFPGASAGPQLTPPYAKR
jgi:hypothetical protein